MGRNTKQSKEKPSLVIFLEQQDAGQGNGFT
jgi:hypothetical protein